MKAIHEIEKLGKSDYFILLENFRYAQNWENELLRQKIKVFSDCIY